MKNHYKLSEDLNEEHLSSIRWAGSQGHAVTGGPGGGCDAPDGEIELQA